MKRIQRKRERGFKLPPNTRCINRGTLWGNPYKVLRQGKQYLVTDKDGNHLCSFDSKEQANGFAVSLYETYLNEKIENKELNLNELRVYENLACFCKLNEPCHGDHLINLLTIKPIQK